MRDATMQYIVFLLAFSLLSSCVGPEPGGFFLGAPVGITSEFTSDVRVKLPGIEPVWPYGPGPDFSAIPGDWGVFPGQHSLIRAMSLGIDVINVFPKELPAGTTLDPPNILASPLDVVIADINTTHGWMALLLSVDSGEGGENLVGDLSDDVQDAIERGDLDRTIFTYVFPGSNVLPVDKTVAALFKESLELSDPGDHVSAVNMHMGLWQTGIETAEGDEFYTAPFPPTDVKVYFTVHKEHLTNPTVAGWFGDYDANNPDTWPSSATILVSNWDGKTWSTPVVHRAYGRLGLVQGDEIDGLSIDTLGTNEELLFSTVAAEIEKQIQFQSFDAAGMGLGLRRLVIKTPEGVHYSAGKRLKVGKGIGDFCTKDPWWADGKVVKTLMPSRHNPYDDFYIAQHRKPLVPGRKHLSASGFRLRKGNGQHYLRTCMSWSRGPKPGPRVEAFVRYGIAPNYMPGSPVGPIEWQASREVVYTGKPLVADLLIPEERVKITGVGAAVAQWYVRVKSPWPFGWLGWRTYVAPLVVLRL